MKITGSYTFDAPQQDVWDLLMDPNVIARALPGVDHLTPVGPNEYEANMKVGLGAVGGQYAARFSLTEIVPPTSYRMTISGKGQRGFVNGTGAITLEPASDQTIVHYVGDAALGGQLAGVAQRLVEGAARTVINQGLRTLDGQLAERRAAALAPATPPAPAEVQPTEGAPIPPPTPPTFTPPPRPTPAPAFPPASPIVWFIAGAAFMAIVLRLFRRK